jgi:hypothetical protein
VQAILFVLGNYFIMPRIQAREARAALFMAYLFSGAAWCVLLSHPPAGALYAASGMLGLANALVLAIQGTLLANALPQQNRAWGFTLAFAASQAGQALALVGLGQAFNAWFGAFPVFLLLASAVQLGLALRLWNLDKPGRGGG